MGKYTLVKLTGNTLTDGNGRETGNETAGVISRHRTVEAARKAQDAYRKASPLGGRTEIRDASGEPVEAE